MKKYETFAYRSTIETIEVERETETSVWINGSRFSKVTRYSVCHDSFEQAKRYLLDRNENKTANLSSQLKKLNNERVDIHGLKETDDIKGQ